MNTNQLANKRARHTQHTVQHQGNLGGLVLLDQEIEVLPKLLDVVFLRQLISADGDDMDAVEPFDRKEGRLE